MYIHNVSRVVVGMVAFLVAATPSWALEPDMSLSDADASFIGEEGTDYSGFSVASGDVNNDGYDDILIGAYGNEYGGGSAGQTYLIFGKAAGWAMDIDLSAADASFVGEDYLDTSGRVACGGDVNNDGYDDILIGAYRNDEGGSDAGQTYLILGKASGWAMDTPLSTADASFIGEDEYDYSANYIASAGDVNNDGYDDILIGAYDGEGPGHDLLYNYGQTYLIFGKASGWAMDTDLSTADASFIGEDIHDRSGMGVASAGDVNGDDFDDILIGAPYDDDAAADAGQTYLILGKATGWGTDVNLSTADASFLGAYHDVSGASACGGDVNADGYDDILIDASHSPGGRGETYLIYGKTTGWAMDTPLSASDASFIGENSADASGSGVASGDVNNDNHSDIIIGAYLNRDGGTYAGQTYLVLGEPSLRMLYPNGGEQLVSGTACIETITWLTGGSIPQILLEYSLDNGAMWEEIGTLANTGSHEWTVPPENSDQCLMRLTDPVNPDVTDVSDDVFTIWTCALTADLNCDQVVNLPDFAEFVRQWLDTCTSPF